ncbi:MAG: exo-beta-N-acetylmuramidase NamZ domain-containing protein, partial [Sediminibacterium sp.]
MILKFGIDNIITQSPSWKKKRIALLTNDAAKTNNSVPSRKALLDHGFNIVKLFSPEHGITATGADGAKMQDSIDDLTHLPVISLYGDKMKPTQEDIQDVEILMFDIPDAGTRFYTYLWSMTYWIETAAEHHLKIVLLDRPNPLGGLFDLCEGPMLHESVSSFIGRFEIPIKHQCTFGELA